MGYNRRDAENAEVKCGGCGAKLRLVGYYRRYAGTQIYEFVGGEPVPAGKAERLSDVAFCLCCDWRIPGRVMDWLLAGVRAKVERIAA